MSNFIARESSDLFDPATGKRVGVIDMFGREQDQPGLEIDPITGGQYLTGANQNLLTRYVSNWSLSNTTLAAVRQSLLSVRNGTARQRMAIDSDSTGTAAGAGTGTGGYTGARPSAWPVKLGTKLAANFRIPCNTDHLFSTHNFSASGPVLPQNFDVRIGAYSPVGWVAANNFGVANSTFYSTTDAAAFPYTPARPFSRIESLFSSNPPLGTATLNVDGGASLGTMNAGQTGAIRKNIYDVTLGAHTINTIKSGTGGFGLLGYLTYDPLLIEMDIVMHTAAGGATSDFIVSTGGYSAAAIPGALAANVAIVCLTTNDAEGGTVIDTYRTRLITIINQWQAAGTAVILMTGIPAGTARGLAGEYEAYFNVVRELSATLSLPLIDYAKYAGSYKALAALGWMYDTRHGNGTLYDDEATFIANALGALI